MIKNIKSLFPKIKIIFQKQCSMLKVWNYYPKSIKICKKNIFYNKEQKQPYILTPFLQIQLNTKMYLLNFNKIPKDPKQLKLIKLIIIEVYSK